MDFVISDDKGRTLTVSGDAPPNQQDVQALFEHAYPPTFMEKYGPQISAAARPALELGGALAGGAVGAGAGAIGLPGVGAVPGGAAGGALGFAGGKAAADLLDRTLGVKKPIASIGDAIKETGGDIKDGMAVEAAGAMAGAPGAKALEEAGAKSLPIVGKGLSNGESLIGQIGRGAIAGGTLSAMQQAQDEGRIEPRGVAYSAAMGGAVPLIAPTLEVVGRGIKALANETAAGGTSLSREAIKELDKNPDLLQQYKGTADEVGQKVEGIQNALIQQHEKAADNLTTVRAKIGLNEPVQSEMARVQKDGFQAPDIQEVIGDWKILKNDTVPVNFVREERAVPVQVNKGVSTAGGPLPKGEPDSFIYKGASDLGQPFESIPKEQITSRANIKAGISESASNWGRAQQTGEADLYHVTSKDNLPGIASAGKIDNRLNPDGNIQGFRSANKGAYGWTSLDRAKLELSRLEENAPGSSKDFVIVKGRAPIKDLIPDEDYGGSVEQAFKDGSVTAKNGIKLDKVERIYGTDVGPKSDLHSVHTNDPGANEQAMEYQTYFRKLPEKITTKDVALPPEARLRDLIRLRQKVDDMINYPKYSADVPRISSRDQAFLGKFRAQINDTIATIPGGAEQRAADQAYSTARNLYDDFQNQLSTDGKAEDVVKRVLMGGDVGDVIGKKREFVDLVKSLESAPQDPNYPALGKPLIQPAKSALAAQSFRTQQATNWRGVPAEAIGHEGVANMLIGAQRLKNAAAATASTSRASAMQALLQMIQRGGGK